MNYIDMFVSVLLVYAVYKGYSKGLIMQLTLLIAILLGVFGALKLSGFTVHHLGNRIHFNPEVLYMISLGLTFLVVFIFVYLMGKLAEKFIRAVELSFLNRLLGILFSVGKIILIVGVILSYADRIDRRFTFLPEGSREHSIFFKPFTSIVRSIFPAMSLPGSDGKEDGSERV